MTTKQRCEDRIAGQWAGRREDFEDIARRENDDDDAVRDAATDDHYELPLCVTEQRVVRIDLSWGGPQDYLEVFLDEDGRPDRVVYHFLDWFDGAERELGPGRRRGVRRAVPGGRLRLAVGPLLATADGSRYTTYIGSQLGRDDDGQETGED